MDYRVLSTGSSGNAVIIEKNILVDAGVPYKAVEPYINDIKLVLITHRHVDHLRASTVRRMALEKPLLRWGCGSFLVPELVKAGVAEMQIDILQPDMLYGYGICNVIPVALHHDVPCYGYKFHFPKGKIFFATDTGSLDGIVARNYQLYLLEANYVDEELQARMDEKISEGQYAYEMRVRKYHLSKRQCDDWLYRMMGSHSEYVYLHCHVDKEKKDEVQDN